MLYNFSFFRFFQIELTSIDRWTRLLFVLSLSSLRLMSACLCSKFVYLGKTQNDDNDDAKEREKNQSPVGNRKILSFLFICSTEFRIPVIIHLFLLSRIRFVVHSKYTYDVPEHNKKIVWNYRNSVRFDSKRICSGTWDWFIIWHISVLFSGDRETNHLLLLLNHISLHFVFRSRALPLCNNIIECWKMERKKEKNEATKSV